MISQYLCVIVPLNLFNQYICMKIGDELNNMLHDYLYDFLIHTNAVRIRIDLLAQTRTQIPMIMHWVDI